MRPQLVHQLLEESATRHPNLTALVDGERALTYAELDRQANRLANLLVDLGVAPGDRVGIYVDKSLEAVVGIYGALKAGAVYVPLDPQAPPTRLGYIGGDCGIRILLSGQNKAASWSAIREAGAPLDTVVVLDGAAPDAPSGIRVIPFNEIVASSDSAPAPEVVNLDLAYILYTSGSTGEPKGVMLSHLNALTFVEWAADLIAVQPDDRLSSHAPLHFDLSVFDLFAAAHGGAAVVLVPHRASVFPLELAGFIRATEVSIWYSVPSILTALALHGQLEVGAFPHLRATIFAGEVFPTKHLRRLMGLLPHARFFNFFGPTETNVCTYHEVPRISAEATAIPIGRSIGGVEAFVLTEDGKPAGVDEVGELFVRGPSVMQGYWGDPERTGKALTLPTLGAGLRAPVYRTGDLVSLDHDGDLWFLGRRDSQIKSRGYRIELGEIEAALQADPAVADCAVIALPDETITNRLAAFIVPGGPIEESALVRHCAARLPRYMIPETFELVTELPRTSTGKVDRSALAKTPRP